MESESIIELVDDFYDNRVLLQDIYYKGAYNNARRSRIILIGCCMRQYAPFCELPFKRQESYIRKIERSCYNAACTVSDKKNISRNWQNENFQTIYNGIAYRVQKNLLWSKDDPGSDYMINLITTGAFDVNNIGKVGSRELRPSKTQPIYDEIERRKQQAVVKKYSSQHECFKCGGRKTTEIERQIRSLDEGATIFVQCEMETCSNKWTIRT